MVRHHYTLNEMFNELDTLRREVEKAIETGGLSRWSRPFSRISFLPGNQARNYPLVRLSEDSDNLYIEALAPGINPDNLEMSVLRDQLQISGEKQPVKDSVKPEDFHRNERATGKFVRTVHLPTEVNGDKVKADYKNGILSLKLPKAEQAKPKQISVKAD
jgi:HSP20 family protein